MTPQIIQILIGLGGTRGSTTSVGSIPVGAVVERRVTA